MIQLEAVDLDPRMLDYNLANKIWKFCNTKTILNMWNIFDLITIPEEQPII